MSSNHETSRGGRSSLSHFRAKVRAVFLVSVICVCAAGMTVASNGETSSNPRTTAAIRELIDLGRYPQAEAAARELLGAAEAEDGTTSRAAADARDALVAALIANGEASKPATRELAERAVALRLETDDAESLSTTAGLLNLGKVLKDSQELDEADEVLRHALEIRERHLGPDHLEIARVLNERGAVAYRERDGDLAEARYEQALAMLEATVGASHPECAVSLTGLAVSMVLRGRTAEAEAYLVRALEVRELGQGPHHPAVADNLRLLAVLRGRSGESEQAQEGLRRALDILEHSLGPDHIQTGSTLNSLAIQARRRGDFAEARRFFERALSIFETSLDPSGPWVAGILNNLAAVHREMGDFPEAEYCLRRSLAIREHRYGAEHESVAQSLNNLASVLIEAERFGEARPFSQRAVKIKAQAYGNDSVEYAASLSTLGRVYMNLGDLDDAGKSLEEAIVILEARLGPDHSEVAVLLNNLAMVRHASGDLSAARIGFQRVIEVWRAALGPENPRIGKALYNLARVEADAGNIETAVELALQAEALGRAHLQLTARGLTEGEALRFDQYTRNRLDLTLAFALKWPQCSTAVWDALIRSRGLVLNELVGRRRVVDADDPKVAALHDELTTAAERLAKLNLRGPGKATAEAYREELESARREVDRLERALGEASAAFRNDRARSSIGFAEVVEGLPTGAALVGITRRAVFPDPIGTDNPKTFDYVAMILSPGMSSPRPIALGSDTEIDALVLEWREASVRAGDVAIAESAEAAEYHRVGEVLRRRVWDPLVPFLTDAEMVFVIPDGELGLVNLATLPAGGSEYLIETGPLIHMLDEERDLVATGVGRILHDPSVLLAVGDPDFDWKEIRTDRPTGIPVAYGLRGVSGSCGSLADVVFPRLPSTDTETEKIAALWRRCGKPDENAESSHPCRRTAVRLTRSEATEAAFKRLAPGKAVLHLATHGFVLGSRCGAGSTTGRGVGGLTPARPDRSPAEEPVADSPGLAGLALAGANHRAEAGPDEEDGVITAAEIANLDLRGVEWAVLSACDSGVGESVSGEGVFGFRRAFRIAGALTVIMSLWPVEDTSGQAWMESLYEARLTLGMTTAESVRHASMELLRRQRRNNQSTHPFFWGAFIAAGDWR